MLVCLAALSALLVAGCGSPKKVSTQTAAASASTCTPAKLATHTKGTLTVATDSPAYPPYFENNKPSNGKGFESAVAYAVAAKLGYRPARSSGWSSRSTASYAPGPKSFDFDINEISITPARAKAVDFSTPYYTNPQGIIVASNSPYAHATSLAAFKSAKFGVQIGTTSLAAVDLADQADARAAGLQHLQRCRQRVQDHRVNAIVVDLATAFDLTSTEMPHTTIAGQFSAPGGDNWGLLLSKGSPLTAVRRPARSARCAPTARWPSWTSAGSRRRRACRCCTDPRVSWRLSRPNADEQPLTTRADRDAARRRRDRRSIAISSASTIIVLGGLTAFVLTSPGWPTVRATFFSWTGSSARSAACCEASGSTSGCS